MDDDHFMKEGLIEANIALEEGNWPIGCVIVLNNKIIARGHNEVYSREDKTAHAEMIALKQVQGILKENHGKATLYSTYEPGPMCFGASILSRIKRVVCGIDLDKSGAMHLRDNLPLLFKQEKFTVDFKTGVLPEECHNVFITGKPTQKLIKDGIIRTNQNTENIEI